MIHECNVQCYTLSSEELELLGKKDDPGTWMPFIFEMSMVKAAKLSTMDVDALTYGCTIMYTHDGDTFIIDTPYKEFFDKFKEFNSFTIIELPPPTNEDPDF
jgi:hypothetical protein